MVNLTHMGVFTDRPAEMRDFYQKVLGLVVSDSGRGKNFKRNITFMTGNPDHHHQFVLVEREEGDPQGGALFQVSFEMDSLDEVRAIANRAKGADPKQFFGLNHGNSWSVYFSDPDNNLIEIYTDTGWYLPQPFGDPLDISQSNEEIRSQTDRRVKEVEGVMPVAEWAGKIKKRLSEVQNER